MVIALDSWVIEFPSAAPLPFRFASLILMNSDSAPFLFAPFGPERDRQLVQRGVDVVELGRARRPVVGIVAPSASSLRRFGVGQDICR